MIGFYSGDFTILSGPVVCVQDNLIRNSQPLVPGVPYGRSGTSISIHESLVGKGLKRDMEEVGTSMRIHESLVGKGLKRDMEEVGTSMRIHESLVGKGLKRDMLERGPS